MMDAGVVMMEDTNAVMGGAAVMEVVVAVTVVIVSRHRLAMSHVRFVRSVATLQLIVGGVTRMTARTAMVIMMTKLHTWTLMVWTKIGTPTQAPPTTSQAS